MRTRIRFAFIMLFMATALTAVAAPRNIVLFVVDDQGRDAGCYGNKVIKTPNLDKLASDGTRFNFAFCTTASCSASRSVLLSGLHNHASGQYGHQHDYHNFHTFPAVRSLPVLLGEAGYRTASIGKFHVQPESVYHFQTYLQGNQGGARNPVTMAEKARDFIARAKEQRPFFLYFCTADPHRSGKVAADEAHQPNYFGNEIKYDGVQEVTYDLKQILVPPYLPDTPETRAELAQYYQSVSRVDQGLGRLIEILKETGQYESTLIIYTSDNGIAFPGAKTNLYEPGMRLPLIVRVPNQKRRGVVSNAMVSWVDLTPTLLDFAGVKEVKAWLLGSQASVGRPAENQSPQDYSFHGRSFLSLLDEENPQGWNEVFGSHTFHEITMYYPMRVIRTRKYKYILNLANSLPFPFASDLYESPTWQGVIRRGDSKYGHRRVSDYLQRPRHELYHLESDPHEVVNLADKPEYANVLAKLQEKLRRFQAQTRDPWIVKYQHE
ncbi:MAG: sulfatase [Acidobacteria bacterium]|nr:sulfatase [Acidobacteriota bacterium]